MFFNNTRISKLIGFILLLTVSSFVSAHKYYAGLTTIDVNPRTQSLEIIHQFFIDDLEAVLSAKQSQPITISEQQTDLVKTLIDQHFKLKIDNNAPSPINWVGMEQDVSTLLIYQEIPNFTDNIKDLTIYNTLLIEQFSEQVNTVIVSASGEQISLVFNRNKSSLQSVNTQ